MKTVGVIGGGIGGMAAAAALQRFGIHAAVYGRAPGLEEVGAGMMLWPNATGVLKELGPLDGIAAPSGVQQRSFLMGQIGQWQNCAVVLGRRLVTSLLPAALFEHNLRRVYSYET